LTRSGRNVPRSAPGRISLGAGIAYRDAVRSVTSADGRRPPAWAVAEGPFGIRLIDVGIVGLVIAAIEVNVITGSGPGAVPLDLRAYLLGERRWPRCVRCCWSRSAHCWRWGCRSRPR